MFGFCTIERIVLIKNRLRTNPQARRLREVLLSFTHVFDSQTKSVAQKCIFDKIDGILDVGANAGQFAIDMRRNRYRDRIYSFEPLVETFAILSEHVSKDERWEAFNFALGEIEDFRKINVSGNSGLSSSLLNMDAFHVENFPDSSYVSCEPVYMSTVDRQVETLNLDPKTSMLKMDVQGYEMNVLQGANQTLKDFRYCYLEVSLVRLYEGESTFYEILNYLNQSNHELVDVFRGTTARDGSLLQVDVLTRSKS